MLSSVQFYALYVLSLFHSVTNYNVQKRKEYEKCCGEITWHGEEQFSTGELDMNHAPAIMV